MVTVTKPAGNEAFKAFVDASAGAMGSLFAAVLLYPLDVVKTRQQVAIEGDSTAEDQQHQNHSHHIHGKKRPSNMFALCWAIYRAEGLEGLFAGLSSKMAHTLFASFAYFYWYAMLKQMAERRSGKTITTGMNLIVAAAAGALNMSMTLPLEMINTRAQITASDSESDSDSEGDVAKTEPKVQHKGMCQLTKEIYSEGGLLAFWKGYIPSLVLVTNPSINFTVFDKLKLRMQQWKKQRVSGGGDVKRLVALTMFEAFVIAAIAKAIATILTYPIIRAKVLMQAQKKHLESEDASAKTSNPQAAHKQHHDRKDYGDSMLAVLQNIGVREGLPGYFKGCSAQLFNTVLKSALLLMTKEQIYTYTMRVLYSLRREKAASAAAAAAAAAAAVASKA